MKEHLYFVYIVASRTRRIYAGITGNLRRSIAQHQRGEIEGFTKRYRIHRLVHFERYQYVRDALAREKEIKGWRREKKVRLIESENPTWADLAEDWERVDLKFNREVNLAARKRADEARSDAGPSPAKAGFGMTGVVHSTESISRADVRTSTQLVEEEDS